MKYRKTLFILSGLFLFAAAAMAVQEHQHDAAQGALQTEMEHATTGMASKHIDMGPHMKMTVVRAVRPGDKDRSEEIVQTARRVLEQYKDYKVAENDGYSIFLPNIPQPMYHFTNYRYGIEASFRFNAEHPTSLLYEKHGDGYLLIGAMYDRPVAYNGG